MIKRLKVFLVVAGLVCLTPLASFALMPYSQDFEALDQGDVGALTNDGWLVYGNVFGYDWAWWYGYGPYGAPNDGAAFCAIVIGQGGPDQGDQQLSVYSDYNNGDHAQAWIEANVFQEQTIEEADIDQTWCFNFDAKLGNLAGQTTALAFIKTLDPDNGYMTTNFITEDMTNTPTTWQSYSLMITIDAGLVGQILQIGFSSTATQWEPSGVFYDNVDWNICDPTATEMTSWGSVKALYR